MGIYGENIQIIRPYSLLAPSKLTLSSDGWCHRLLLAILPEASHHSCVLCCQARQSVKVVGLRPMACAGL